MPPGKPDPDVIEGQTEAPPFLGTWPRVYAMVLSYLALLLILLHFITRLFHY